MRVRISEVDMEMLYLIARGFTYKEISASLALSMQTVKNRMANVLRVFGATSMPNLIAMLIASDVLRVQDLYTELDVEVFEHGVSAYRRQSYRLTDVRP